MTVVEEIWIGEVTEGPLTAVDTVKALAGVGLEGDRYATGKGHYSGDPIWDADITFIGIEAFEAVNAEQGGALKTSDLRRNVVLRGIDPHDLVGQTFRIGGATFHGTKVWPPCRYIADRLGDLQILRWFAHRAGIGASVVTAGSFSVGDALVLDAG